MICLPFTTKEAAEFRNSFEAFRRGCQSPTLYWWPMVEGSELFYLNVGDMSGLTDEEKLRVVELDDNGDGNAQIEGGLRTDEI